MNLNVLITVSLLLTLSAYGKDVSLAEVDAANRKCLVQEQVIKRIHHFAIPESPESASVTIAPAPIRGWKYGLEQSQRVYPGYRFDFYIYWTLFRTRNGGLWTFNFYKADRYFGKNEFRRLWLEGVKFPQIGYEKLVAHYDKYGVLVPEKSLVSGLRITHSDLEEVVMVNNETNQPSELKLDLRSYIECLSGELSHLP